MRGIHHRRSAVVEAQARLAWLDVVKGLAILWVILYHVALPLFGIPPFDHPKDNWAPLGERLAQLQWVAHETYSIQLARTLARNVGWLGYQGVHLFLVLSGFALAWSQMRRPSLEGSGLWAFYCRRLGRIVPLYWAGHFAFLLLQLILGPLQFQPGISLRDSRFYLSLIGVRFLPDTFFYISPAWWYVGLILQLYLVFPVLWEWLQRRGLVRFWIGTAAITLASRYVLLMVVGRQQEMWSMGAVFVTRLFEFTLGMGLAHWLAHKPQGFEHFWGNRWTPVIALPVYLVGLALSFTVAGSIAAHSLLAASLFAFAYVLGRHVLMPLKLIRRAVVFLGSQSYGLMLLHQPILWWFISWAGARMRQPFLFALLIPVLALLLLGSIMLDGIVSGLGRWLTAGIPRLRLAVAARDAVHRTE